ncbi:MAG: ROK family protein [Acidobacteriota bacterium]
MIICLESGGTKLVAAIAETNGQLRTVARRYREPEQEALETLTDLVEMGRELAGSEPLHAVSYGFGGTVRRADQRPGPCFHEPGWEGIDPPRYLRDAFRAPVFIENDCNLGALGEAHFGVHETRSTLFYVTIGTGIGGGIVHDGRLLQTGALGEAEIGHVVVDEAGPECPCGNRGCLETLCAGPGLSRLASRMLGVTMDARTLMERFRKHDPPATRVVEQAAGYLGRVLAMTINLLAPQTIVMGGGVMTNNQAFLELVAARTEPYIFPFFRNRTRFLLSALGENVVCQGAAVYAIQRLREQKETRTT